MNVNKLFVRVTRLFASATKLSVRVTKLSVCVTRLFASATKLPVIKLHVTEHFSKLPNWLHVIKLPNWLPTRLHNRLHVTEHFSKLPNRLPNWLHVIKLPNKHLSSLPTAPAALPCKERQWHLPVSPALPCCTYNTHSTSAECPTSP